MSSIADLKQKTHAIWIKIKQVYLTTIPILVYIILKGEY